MAYIQKCLRIGIKKLINNHKPKYIKIKLQYINCSYKVHYVRRSFQRFINKVVLTQNRFLHADEDYAEKNCKSGDVHKLLELAREGGDCCFGSK